MEKCVMGEKMFRVRIHSDVMVCVDEIRNMTLAGRILFPYEVCAIPFENTADMILKIDGMFEKAEKTVRKEQTLWQYHDFKDFSGIRGKRDVFFLRVLYRNDQNMQGLFFSGRLRRRPMAFRSTMELTYYLRELTELLEEGEKHV